MGGDEHLLDAHIVAAGGAHPRGVPDIVDDDIGCRHEREACGELGFGLDRVHHHPVGVVNAGGPLPPARQHEPTVHDGQGARWGERCRSEGPRTLRCEQFVTGLFRELREEPVVQLEKRDRPCRRNASGGEDARRVGECRQAETMTAERCRHDEAPEVEVTDVAKGFRGKSPCRLGVSGPLGERWPELHGSFEKLFVGGGHGWRRV